jgi:Asp-tRNA(Asn)/Glu-tRNA(Gln) amidotransferase A subunit family amidase
VGLELLGKPYQEHRLIEMAYAFEQVTDSRSPPESTR